MKLWESRSSSEHRRRSEAQRLCGNLGAGENRPGDLAAIGGDVVFLQPPGPARPRLGPHRRPLMANPLAILPTPMFGSRLQATANVEDESKEAL
jgi:hypothetical protein